MSKIKLRGHILPRVDLFDGHQLLPLGTPSFFNATFKSIKKWIQKYKPNIITEHTTTGTSDGVIEDVVMDDDGIWVVFTPTDATLSKFQNEELKYVSAHIIWNHQANDYHPDEDNRWHAALVETSLVSVPRFAIGQKYIDTYYVPTSDTYEILQKENYDNKEIMSLINDKRALTKEQYEMLSVLSLDVANSFKPSSKPKPHSDSIEAWGKIEELNNTILKLTPGEKMTKEQLIEALLSADVLSELKDKLMEDVKPMLADMMKEREETEEVEVSETEKTEEVETEEVSEMQETEKEETEEVPEVSEMQETEKEETEDLLETLMKQNEELLAKLSEYEQKEANSELEEAGVEDELKPAMLSLRDVNYELYNSILSQKKTLNRVPRKMNVSKLSEERSKSLSSKNETYAEKVSAYMKQGLSFSEAKVKASK